MPDLASEGRRGVGRLERECGEGGERRGLGAIWHGHGELGAVGKVLWDETEMASGRSDLIYQSDDPISLSLIKIQIQISRDFS